MTKFLEKIKIADIAFFLLMTVYYIAPDSSTFAYVGYILTAAFGFFVIFDDPKSFKFPIICGVFALFAFFCFVSMFYTIDTTRSQDKVLTLTIATFIFFVGSNYFSKKENTEKFEFTLIAVAVMACLYLALKGGIFGGQAIGDAIANKNLVGIRLTTSAIVCVYSMLRKFAWWKLPILALLGLCIFLTGSRSSLIVLTVGVVVMIVLGFSSKDKPIGYATILILIAIMIILYLIFNVPLLYNVLGYRLEGFFDLFANGTGDSSTTKRLELIENGIELFRDSPLVGHGVNTYVAVSNSLVGFLAYSHNDYVELLVGVGLIGTIIYYITPISLVGTALSLSKQSKETKLLGSLCFALMTAYFVSNLFTVNYYNKHFVVIFAFVYGSYLGYHIPEKEEVPVLT